jgi:rRNA maturation RNase YbeY
MQSYSLRWISCTFIPDMSSIQFFFPEPVSVLKQRKNLKLFLSAIAKKNKRPVDSLNIIFCNDEYLLEINRSYLQHDYYTDIITFDLSVSVNSPITAELYISVDTVKDNARELGVPYYRELHRVVFHGLLHLLGYKDKNKKDQLLMREMEEKLLKQYFKF